VNSKEVKIGDRKITAKWTREMAEDLSSYHGLDIEKELENVLEEELKKTPEYQAEQKRKQREKKLKRILGDAQES
jgi:hypothetical protein